MAKEEEAHQEEEGEEGEEKEEKERPQFDEEGFLQTWYETNPKVEVPEEVIDDIDNDYALPENE